VDSLDAVGAIRVTAYLVGKPCSGVTRHKGDIRLNRTDDAFGLLNEKSQPEQADQP
jgi:hypothetical protein